MQKILFKSKIHRAVITQAELYYEGSLTIDEALLEAAKIQEYEQVYVANVSNGERFETYAIKGERDSGVICLNGAAARKGSVGDEIIIITYGMYDEKEAAAHKPIVVKVDKRNRVSEVANAVSHSLTYS